MTIPDGLVWGAVGYIAGLGTTLLAGFKFFMPRSECDSRQGSCRVQRERDEEVVNEIKQRMDRMDRWLRLIASRLSVPEKDME